MPTPTPERGLGDTALLRLLQLVSPALPVGAYAYSQGLEWAVQAGWVDGPPSAEVWILGLLEHPVGNLDLPLFARLYRAWQADDAAAVAHWNGWLDAARESGELQAEDRHLAHALARLLSALGVEAARAWVAPAPACFATVFALAATHWAVPLRPAALGLLWTWAENQVAAATKLVPLGQTAAQRLLSAVIARLPAVVDRGLALADDDIGSGAPAWALASALHETQYTRLFRS